MNKPIKALAVLIVEDMESDAQLIVRLLKKAGYELVYEQVETAEQMRLALEKHAWDIVISDYKLPQFDGRAALKLLQETGRDIPFIVVSGTIGEETAVAMMKAGAHDYLVKGDLARLVPAVERELDQAKIRRERKRAEERFELIKDSIDAASDGVYWMDREGWFIYVNDAGCKALGYSRDELLQLRVFDINPTVTAQQWAELWHVLRDKKVLTAESVHRRKDGSEFPVELTSNYIKFGEQEYVNEFARDITARVQVQEALRESEERYRSLFDRMLDGMYRSTHAGKFVDVNPAMVKMFGYSSREEMLEMDIKNELYFDPKERGTHIIDTGHGETDVYRLRRKDGSEIWVEDRGNYTYDEQGGIVFHEGMMRDVTERVQAQKALAASEAELRALFASMQDVVLVIDRDGTYLKIAPTNPGLLVKPPAELLGKNLRDVFPAEQAEIFIGTLQQVLDTKQTTQIEYELLIGDRTVWFETSISPMDKDSTLWVARDVSGRKRAADELQKLATVVQYSSELVNLATLDGRMIFLNEAGSRMLGINPAEVGQHTIMEVIPGQWQGMVQSELLPALMENGHWEGDLQYLNIQTNALTYVHAMTFMIKDVKTGASLYLANVSFDITERVQAQESLRESEERFRSVFENAAIGLYRTTPDEHILLANTTFARMLGCESVDELMQRNKDGDSVVTGYPRSEFLQLMERKGEVKGFEAYGKRIDGTVIFVRENAKVVRDSNGEILYFEGSVEDITERVRAEEALRKSESNLKKAQHFAHTGSWMWNIKTNELEWSDEMYHIFGINKETFSGVISDVIARSIHPDDRYKVEQSNLSVINETKPIPLEYRIIWPDGSEHVVWAEAGELILDETGHPSVLSGTVQDITLRKQAEQDIRQRVTELELLYESGLALSQLLDPKEIGQKILELLKEKLNWHYTTIRLYHPQDESLELLAFNYLGVKNEKERLAVQEHLETRITKSGEGLSGWAIQNSQTVRSSDVSHDPRYAKSFPGIRSGLYVPMKLGERMIGVISIESEQPDAFSEADEQLVITLANQAASAFENARLFEETRQRAMELETLNRISLVLRAVSKQDEMLSIVLDEALAILNTSHGSIQLYNKTTDNLDKTILRGWTAQVTELPHNSGEGITGKVFTSGETYISREFASNPETRAASRSQIPPGWGGACLPIRTTQQTLGVMIVSVPSERELNKDEMRLLSTLAEMTGGAMHRMRLFDETARRAEELTTLQATVLDISSPHPLLELLNLIVERAANLLGASSGGLYLTEPEHCRVRCLVSYKTKQDFTGTLLDYGVGAAGYVAETGKPIIIDDYRSWPNRASVYEPEQPFQAVMSAPMLWQGNVTGVIHLLRDDTSQKFTQEELNLLTLFANHAAVAVENARLFYVTRQRVMDLETLYESGLALSQLLNPKEIGQKILELLKEKLGWQHTRIRLYHPQDDSLELLDFNRPGLMGEMERHEMVEHFQTLITRSDQGMSGWVIKHGQPVRSGDVSNDPRYIEAYPGIRSGLYVPMKLGERVIGVIGTESEQPNAFSEADERLVATLANQAASAFENARLFEMTCQHAMELETLNRISLILRVVSKQDEMLAIVLDEALDILNTSHGSIELWDEANDILQKKVVRGWPAQVIESPQNSDEGISGRVITSGEIYVSREFASDPMVRAESRDQVPPGWGGACLPIRTAQQTLGVLVVSVPSERELNRDEIRLLSTLAEMTGSALHRMRLFDETARRAQEFEALYETSQTLSAENELVTLLKTIVEHARALLGAESSGIYLYDEARGDMEVMIDTAHYLPIGTRLRFGEGMAGRVAKTRQPLRVENYSAWEGRSPKYDSSLTRAVLEVPMLYGGELIGVLTANEMGSSERVFTDADERLLSLFASQAAGVIHSARLHEETVHRLEHLQALRAVDQAIASSLDMRLTLNIILTHALPQLGVDAADVLLLHSGSNLLEIAASRGLRTRLLESVTVSESFAGRAVMEHRTITVSDIETAGQHSQFGKLWKEEDFSAYWCVPLIVKGEVRGVLEVYRRTAFTPDAEWLEFLEALAGQAAITIDNTQLFENLQRANMDLILAYNATIEGWSHALDLRDRETEGHTERVADLTEAIAKTMGIKDQGMLNIRRGALLHDIGKMGIPDHILLKPDKLTDEEWVIMRTHPQLARDLLMPIAYLRDALDIPYSHHEKWDGTGYPQGLKGQQIPLTARFFAVVDVWDALTSDRPYRKKWTKKKALTYIHEQRGKYFDPQVVDAFEKIVK